MGSPSPILLPFPRKARHAHSQQLEAWETTCLRTIAGSVRGITRPTRTRWTPKLFSVLPSLANKRLLDFYFVSRVCTCFPENVKFSCIQHVQRMCKAQIYSMYKGICACEFLYQLQKWPQGARASSHSDQISREDGASLTKQLPPMLTIGGSYV